MQALPALDAEAVAPEVVVAAGWADQAARRIRLQPALVLAAVPDAIFRPEHPAPPLAVEHGQVSDGEPERARGQAAFAPFVDEHLVANLRVCEWIDCHGESIARSRSEGQ